MWNPVELKLTGRVPVGATHASERTLAVAALFGIALQRGEECTLFEDVEMAMGPGDVVLITGPSGAGKSTLLRCITEKLQEQAEVNVMLLDGIPLPADRAVVDCFAGGVEAALAHLARAGLSEAHLCLRAPAELSEGQRFRYRLAQFFASDAQVLVADEFAATLDRVTARVVAHQLGKFIRATGRAAVVATTHEDLAEDLGAAVRIWKGFGARVEIMDLRAEKSGI
jgi:ABC-type ATPase with predicted acetyltransferase domain